MLSVYIIQYMHVVRLSNHHLMPAKVLLRNYVSIYPRETENIKK